MALKPSLVHLPAADPDSLLRIENMMVHDAALRKTWEYQVVQAVVDELGQARSTVAVARTILRYLLTDNCCMFLNLSADYKRYKTVHYGGSHCPYLTWDNRILVANKMPTFYKLFTGILKTLCEEPTFSAMNPVDLRRACCVCVCKRPGMGSHHPQLPWTFS